MADTMSEREFAKEMGSSLSTVQSRIRRGLMPRSAKKVDGHWRIDPKAGRLEFEAAEAMRATKGTDAEELLKAKARREQAMADLAELELMQRQGKLCFAADMERVMVEAYTRAKTKLLGIPSRLRQQDPGLTLKQIALVESLIRETLEELANPDGTAPEADHG